uniref:Uncharacterized protein n=1 Tax=Fagus sylvatica TaxID=28930 RepID=A0A2N9HYN4_FAGSY
MASQFSSGQSFKRYSQTRSGLSLPSSHDLQSEQTCRSSSTGADLHQRFGIEELTAPIFHLDGICFLRRSSLEFAFCADLHSSLLMGLRRSSLEFADGFVPICTRIC